jgi:hypothetical protein
MFALATAALAIAVETVRPQWRDPEYGHRLNQVRRWQQQRPERPLVLVFGSSCAQMGVSPRDMGFPDEPGQPLVYNFGYRGVPLLGSFFQLNRVLDAGVRPRAVLLMLSIREAKLHGEPGEQFGFMAPRMSGRDVAFWAPYTPNPGNFRRAVVAARRDPWSARREALFSDLLPDWQPELTRLRHDGWERMDEYGYAPYPEAHMRLLISHRPDLATEHRQEVLRTHAPNINCGPPNELSMRAIRDFAGRCRAEGVALAVVWAPESPEYRALYTPATRTEVAAYEQMLRGELGVQVVPAPTHLEEDDFPDGYHLYPGGASRYSRWLADIHLKPWLAEVLP